MKLRKACAALCALMLACLCACTPVADAEIVLLAGKNGVEDHSFLQSAWNGVRLFASAHGKTFNFFVPSAQKTAAFRSSVDSAVAHGAKVLIFPGQDFDEFAAPEIIDVEEIKED